MSLRKRKCRWQVLISKLTLSQNIFFLLIFTIDERYEQQKNNSSSLAADGIILLFA